MLLLTAEGGRCDEGPLLKGTPWDKGEVSLWPLPTEGGSRVTLVAGWEPRLGNACSNEVPPATGPFDIAFDTGSWIPCPRANGLLFGDVFVGTGPKELFMA